MTTIAASLRERAVGSALLAAACAYLIRFVPRGWMPHDEGMLGQSADRVLHGGLPHIDYEEAYTGGLSWLYAAVFRAYGVDLLNIRWLLFAGACCAAWLIYAIARRYLRPAAAALATWVSVVWSFPNYFAGLPSWWLLVCALLCVWAVIRFTESRQIRYILLAGLAAGLAIAIKQTGLYVFIALVIVLLYDAGRAVRLAATAAAILFGGLMLAPRIFEAEGLYLFVPVVACALALSIPFTRVPESHMRWRPVLAASAAAALLPLALLVPYVRDQRLWSFVNGAFLLPQKRLAFASMSMPSAWLLATGLPLLAVVLIGPRRGVTARARAGAALTWAAAVALPIAALWHVASYQAIWQSSRAFAALLPIAVCWRLARRPPADARQRVVLFASASMLAWASLNQFPFAAPIYFCYIAPLAVVTAIAAAGNEASLRQDTMLPWAAALVLFGVLSSNRSYIEWLGVSHVPRRFDAALALPRAHLNVDEGDARTYRRLVDSIGHHLRGGRFLAGPDCPEVYFLAGLTSPSGALFDFFSERDDEGAAAWLQADVIVLNHAPWFSPKPPAPLVERLRREFPNGEDIARFEIRWR